MNKEELLEAKAVFDNVFTKELGTSKAFRNIFLQDYFEALVGDYSDPELKAGLKKFIKDIGDKEAIYYILYLFAEAIKQGYVGVVLDNCERDNDESEFGEGRDYVAKYTWADGGLVRLHGINKKENLHTSVSFEVTGKK